MPEKKTIDWPALHAEYLAGQMTLNTLRLKYKIGNQGHFYEKTKGWAEERENHVRRMLEKIKKKQVEIEAKRWEKQFRLWEAVEARAAQILNKSLQGDRDMNGQELRALASAIKDALHGQRLIGGHSTANIAISSTHRQLIEISKKIDRGDPIDDLEGLQDKDLASSESIQDS